MQKKIWQHHVLWIIPILIFIIFIFSITPSLKDFRHTFRGDSENIPYPGFSKHALASHQFQNYTEHLFEHNIRLRNKFIGGINQLYYSLFKKSFAVNSTLIVGKHNQLFHIDYIRKYCYKNYTLAELTTWADDIAQMQHYFTTRGKTFIYVMTPSKAEYIPENIPDRFHCKTRGIKDSVFTMDKLLTERHVPHVIGPNIIANAAKTYNTPMFAPGGLHWNWLGATVEAAAILDALRKQGISIPQLAYSYTMEKPKSKEIDDDLLSVAKLWKHHATYQTPQLQFHNPTYQGKPLTLALIGGSFNWNLNTIFLRNKVFSKTHFYFYFDKHEVFESNIKPVLTSSKVDMRDILSSDVVILEENSSLLISDHGKRLYKQLQLNA